MPIAGFIKSTWEKPTKLQGDMGKFTVVSSLSLTGQEDKNISKDSNLVKR